MCLWPKGRSYQPAFYQVLEVYKHQDAYMVMLCYIATGMPGSIIEYTTTTTTTTTAAATTAAAAATTTTTTTLDIHFIAS